MKLGFDWPSGFRGGELLKMVDGQRTPEHGYTIISACGPAKNIIFSSEIVIFTAINIT